MHSQVLCISSDSAWDGGVDANREVVKESHCPQDVGINEHAANSMDRLIT